VEYHIARGLEEWRKWDGDYNDYDAIVIIYYWSQAPESELEKLDRYVRDSGALVIVHSALAGFWGQKIFDEWSVISVFAVSPQTNPFSLILTKPSPAIMIWSLTGIPSSFPDSAILLVNLTSAFDSFF
jgi:hypothetical protein